VSTTQVAVRLTDELLETLDWLVARCDYENRAEAIRASLEAHARRERSREIGERIAEGYRRIPQTPDEVPDPHFAGWDSLDDGDWSGWS
jgi:Arc/MetJ-type ribon-helix-helix transcriptional regulator